MLQHAADLKNERAGNVTFGGAIGYELLLASGLALVLTLAAWGYFQNDLSPTDLVFSTAVGLLVFYCWPRPIRFASGAIVQRNLFGGTKSILLSEIAAAKFDARQRCVLITGNIGVRIVHSMLHARREQFAQQLTHLAGVRVSGLNA